MITALVFVEVIENVGRLVEALGVAVTAIAVVVSLGRYAASLATRSEPSPAYERARQDVGRGVLLGLEILVAGDIIRTVGVTATLTSVVILGAVVLIRTFLTITIRTEVAPQHAHSQTSPPDDEVERRVSRT